MVSNREAPAKLAKSAAKVAKKGKKWQPPTMSTMMGGKPAGLLALWEEETADDAGGSDLQGKWDMETL